MNALIVAFDGVLADTLPLRTHALVEACAAEQRSVAAERVRDVLPGRSMLEAALALLPAAALEDPTVPELIALRAQRAYRQLVQFGAPVRPDIVRDMLRAHEAGTRVVLRADSERRDVEPLLTMYDLAHRVQLLCCSDDRIPLRDTSFRRCWREIDARLDALHQPISVRTAWESANETADAAASFVTAVLVR